MIAIAALRQVISDNKSHVLGSAFRQGSRKVAENILLCLRISKILA
jgi:hypothetical protein